MSILSEERSSDSPYVETVIRGRTASDGIAIRPALNRWHMVVTRQHGNVRLLVVGPWTTAGFITYTDDAELLWIRFALGTFMPHFSPKDARDAETILPGAAGRSFWLHGAAWQFPDYGNADTFVSRLVHEGTLLHDPLIAAALSDELPETPDRTVRHRFLRATGLTQSHIRQVERAHRAAALLQRGVPILDTVDEAGYYDQPHLTRSLRRWIGHTPAQLLRAGDLA